MFLAYLQGIETGKSNFGPAIASRFLAYLQGIETRKVSLNQFLKSLFLAYLQGIETSAINGNVLAQKFVSSLPTRDWNNIEEGA